MGGSSSTTDEWVRDLRAFKKMVRFRPDDEEMVEILKMQGKDSQFIPRINCCKHDPWELPWLSFPDSPYQPGAWFFFSLPDCKPINSLRRNRVTKNGRWKITGESDAIEIGPQQHSNSATYYKRTLTFEKVSVSESCQRKNKKSEWTGWVMQEYYCTRTELCSTSNPNQQPHSFLCRLTKNAAKNKSVKKKLKLDSICNEFTDPGTGGCMIPHSEDDQAAEIQMIPAAEEHLAYKELVDVVLGRGNQDDGEPGGCVSSGFDNQAVDDNQQGKYLDSPFFPPEPPWLHQPPQLGNFPYVCHDELVDPRPGGYIASNSGNQAAAINHMIPDPEEFPAYKQLEHSLFGNSNHYDVEPGGYVLSDHYDMMQVLCAQLGEDFDPPFPPPEPSQLGNAPDVYTDECSNWPPPIGNNDSYVTNKNSMSTNYDIAQVSNITNSFQTRATGERISAVCSQPDENLEALFLPIQQEHYTLQLPILYSEQGDVPHANNYIGCNESQSPYPEVPALFPHRS